MTKSEGELRRYGKLEKKNESSPLIGELEENIKKFVKRKFISDHYGDFFDIKRRRKKLLNLRYVDCSS